VLKTVIGISSAQAFAEAEDITDRVRVWQGWIATDPLGRWIRTVVRAPATVPRRAASHRALRSAWRSSPC
jgi:hypothetical protein